MALQVFVKTLADKTITVETTRTTNERDFIRLVAERVGDTSSSIRLLFGGKQLDENKEPPRLLEAFGLNNGSTLFLVKRLPGGVKLWLQSDNGAKTQITVTPETVDNFFAQVVKVTGLSEESVSLYRTGFVRVERAASLRMMGLLEGSTIAWCKGYSLKDTTLKFADPAEPDAITGDKDDDVKRALMPCGHAVDPGSLTAWTRTIVDRGIFNFRCPKPTRGEEKCGQLWDYPLVRKLALLTADECAYIEVRLSENAAITQLGAKVHTCGTFCIPQIPGTKRLRCTVCMCDFCWICSKPWSGGPNCGNTPCEDPKLTPIKECGTKQIGGVTVPAVRLCPKCGLLIEHQKACKYVHCLRCWQTFCFMCLETQEECKTKHPATHFALCRLAPRQTRVPIYVE